MTPDDLRRYSDSPGPGDTENLRRKPGETQPDSPQLAQVPANCLALETDPDELAAPLPRRGQLPAGAWFAQLSEYLPGGYVQRHGVELALLWEDGASVQTAVAYCRAFLGSQAICDE